MARPKPGSVIRTEKNKTVTVLEVLGSGGQGTVYKVDYNGEKKALKWYHDTAFDVLKEDPYATGSIKQKVVDRLASEKKKEQFRDNLINNISHGSPSAEFMWPLDITVETHGSFGYIMDLVPSNYVELSKLLIQRKFRFSSYIARVNGMINLVNAFRVFHNKGYNYQDLNDGNFFFDPDTGDILVADNDNAAYDDYKTGIIGKCRFMAPEVVLNQKMPDTFTDRFSLAVVLFFMMFRCHPLEGQAATPACMTPAHEIIAYGSRPIFIFDEQDQSNRPVRGVSEHSVIIWNRTPDYLKDAFRQSFSKSAMTFKDGRYGAARLIEKQWLNVLCRFRNDIVCCSNPACSREEFYTGQETRCAVCGTPLMIGNKLKLPHYEIPLHRETKIYKVQMGPCRDEDALDPIAEVAIKEGSIGLRNTSAETWKCITTTGSERPLPPNGVLPAKVGIKISVSNGTMEII